MKTLLTIKTSHVDKQAVEQLEEFTGSQHSSQLKSCYMRRANLVQKESLANNVGNNLDKNFVSFKIHLLNVVKKVGNSRNFKVNIWGFD